MPDITSGTLIGRWKAGEFDLLLVSKAKTIFEKVPSAILERYSSFKGPVPISYELTLAVMRDTQRYPVVMFINIERGSGEISRLLAEELANDDELAKEMGTELSAAARKLSASGTLCLGVFCRPGLHENLGSLDKVDVAEFRE